MSRRVSETKRQRSMLDVAESYSLTKLMLDPEEGYIVKRMLDEQYAEFAVGKLGFPISSANVRGIRFAHKIQSYYEVRAAANKAAAEARKAAREAADQAPLTQQAAHPVLDTRALERITHLETIVREQGEAITQLRADVSEMQNSKGSDSKQLASAIQNYTEAVKRLNERVNFITGQAGSILNPSPNGKHP